MKNIKLGNGGLEVPTVGLGCMGMSEFYGDSDDASNLKVLDLALELGCGFWDTSDMYGPYTNEELLGKAIKGRREQVVLATKFGIKRSEAGDIIGIDGRPEYVKSACEASLNRLGIEQIDLYYQHRVDPQIPIEETVGAMSRLVDEGKVKYLGLSEADAPTIERAHKEHPIAALQTEYSLWSREVEAEILPTLRRLGIGFVAYSPLGRGFLSGDIKSREDLAENDWRRQNPRFEEEAIAHNNRLVEAVADIAKDHQVTAAQLSLAWLLAQGDDIAMIPGTKREKYLRQNCAATDVSLSAENLQELDELTKAHAVSGSRY